MMVRKAKLGISLLAIAMGLTLVPAVTASAAVETSANCKAYNSDVKLLETNSAAVAKQLTSGKWSSIQKGLLAEASHQVSAEKHFLLILNGAPAKVKAAANVLLGQGNQFKSIVEHSSSVEQFGAAIEKVEVAPKELKAVGVLDNYAAKTLKC